ncbi:AprI/Inh family metalloprotease inhibitor [Microvirga antarctica]|uniref:AprI/Inh family metalloprotease inhibitor n=1 Tax=Microvirga antarctica TaxID=2819233 RepID=UPI001B30395F|nr:AprI/Inh family metalloprotease inhibitor [Microvirga antarctica]
MSRHTLRTAAALCAILALGACSSARVGGYGGQPIRSANAAPTMTMEQPIEAVPSSSVSSAPLAPIESRPLGPVGGSAPPPPLMPAPAPGAAPTDMASLPPTLPPVIAPVAPTPAPAPAGNRTAMVGNWTAKDASGGSCRIQLSSSPALDLYRASASGCANQDLSKINAWDFRDGEVYLYQQGGSVAARLRGSSGALSGAIAKSGAPLSLSR